MKGPSTVTVTVPLVLPKALVNPSQCRFHLVLPKCTKWAHWIFKVSLILPKSRRWKPITVSHSNGPFWRTIFFPYKEANTHPRRLFTSKQVTVAEPLVVSAHQNSSGLRKAKEEFFFKSKHSHNEDKFTLFTVTVPLVLPKATSKTNVTVTAARLILRTISQ